MMPRPPNFPWQNVRYFVHIFSSISFKMSHCSTPQMNERCPFRDIYAVALSISVADDGVMQCSSHRRAIIWSDFKCLLMMLDGLLKVCCLACSLILISELIRPMTRGRSLDPIDSSVEISGRAEGGHLGPGATVVQATKQELGE